VPFENTDRLTEVVIKLVVSGGLLALAVSLLGFRRGLAKHQALQAIGWVLAVSAPVILLAAVARFDHAADTTEEVVAYLVALILPLALAGSGVALIKRGRRGALAMAGADTSDTRPPVLYLRPFDADARTARVRIRQDAGSLSFNTRTEEELLVHVLNEIGPCVAVGRPGESLPPLGFRRRYVDDDVAWQEAVLEVMCEARLVVLMGGSSPGYAWEVGKAWELVAPQRLLFLVPANPAEREKFFEVLERAVPAVDRRVPEDAVLPARAFKAILYFDADRAAHYAPAEIPSHFRRTLWPSIAPALKMALRPVYRQLAVAWSPPPLVLSRMLYDGMLAVAATFFILVLLRMV